MAGTLAFKGHLLEDILELQYNHGQMRKKSAWYMCLHVHIQCYSNRQERTGCNNVRIKAGQRKFVEPNTFSCKITIWGLIHVLMSKCLKFTDKRIEWWILLRFPSIPWNIASWILCRLGIDFQKYGKVLWKIITV